MDAVEREKIKTLPNKNLISVNFSRIHKNPHPQKPASTKKGATKGSFSWL
jgi:hypothetical protein